MNVWRQSLLYLFFKTRLSLDKSVAVLSYSDNVL